MANAGSAGNGETQQAGKASAPALDPGPLIRSRQYRVLLVFAAVIGVAVSVASWAFLELSHYIPQWVYSGLPNALGFKSVPLWWPLPVLLVAGLIVAIAIVYLPGNGGHEPAKGLETGSPTKPIELPGVLIAALASIGLGLVLGPEAPLIALGMGFAILLARLPRKGMPDQARLVLAAAGAFAAISSLFGSPIIGAVIIIEGAGLGGSNLPLILLPGLVAAGIGSLVFIGVGQLTGLSSSAYAIQPLKLPAYPHPSAGAFIWTIVVSIVAAAIIFAVFQLGRSTRSAISKRRIALTVLAAAIVAAIAIIFSKISGITPNVVLFSGQDAMNKVVSQAATISLGTIAFLIICKGLAWGLSLGGFRGGPTFPAIFLGVAGGLLAGHLPGFNETAAIGVLAGVAVVSALRLPLSAVIIALVLTQPGAGVGSLIIVGVAVAYITVQVLAARWTSPGPGQVQGSPAVDSS